MKPKRQNPVKTGKIEKDYARSLKKISRHIGDIINAFTPGDPAADPVITRALHDYSNLIDGWARATGARMIAATNRADEQAWTSHAQEMSKALRYELMRAPMGILKMALLEEQVRLIKSLPIDAAERVHKLTLEGLEDSTRASEIAKEIMRSGQVSASRATLIARTEVARTASFLTESRAKSIGSSGYIWRTAGDGDVRESHREVNGKFFQWDSPPTLSDGTTCSPGTIYNCRCFAEPIIPE